MMNMLKWPAALSIAVLPFLVSPVRADITGENLKEYCAAYPRPVQNTAFCIAYIAGALDATRYINQTVSKPFVCEPPNVSGKQLTLMAIEFLARHPEKLHLSGAVLIFNMYAEAFPCRKR